jgi:hypothetical protein
MRAATAKGEFANNLEIRDIIGGITKSRLACARRLQPVDVNMFRRLACAGSSKGDRYSWRREIPSTAVASR